MNTTHPAFNPAIAYGVYKTRRLAFFIAGLTAFVMSTYFVVGYLVDGTRFRDWGVNEWFFALPGIGICLVMTAMQIVLYAKDSKAATLTTVIAVGVAAGFSILSEIGQGMERDNLRMTSRSLQSPTYQAIVASMASASSATHTPTPTTCSRHRNAWPPAARRYGKASTGTVPNQKPACRPSGT